MAPRAHVRRLTLLALLGSLATPASARVPPDPEWYRSAVVYGVVPPRLGAEPLKAVAARLDDLRDLGVDALWLAPIHPTDDPGDVSYSVIDYFAVRADFGTPEDLRTLVREAHARGIRVLLDFVPARRRRGPAVRVRVPPRRRARGSRPRRPQLRRRRAPARGAAARRRSGPDVGRDRGASGRRPARRRTVRRDRAGRARGRGARAAAL